MKRRRPGAVAQDFLLGGRTSASAECGHWSGKAVRWSNCAILLRIYLLEKKMNTATKEPTGAAAVRWPGTYRYGVVGPVPSIG